MKNISTDELLVILNKHREYLLSYGNKGKCADLRDANLFKANFSDANLFKANLRGADLRGANLFNANLFNANLFNANLFNADLFNADLRGANLFNANLFNADLFNADLRGADLRGAKNINIPMSCPEKGSFIGFKKVRKDLIVELQILEDSLRSSATGRKCRCSKAKVLSITNLDGTDSKVTSACSKYDEDFIYTIGEIVEVKDFDTDRFNECAPGIHFFITRDEAANYCN